MQRPDRNWLSETAEVIVGAGLDPSRWKDITKQIVAAFPGANTIVHAVDRRAQTAITNGYAGYDEKQIAELEAHYFKINPWTPFWKSCETLRAYASDTVMPSSLFTHTEFYQDWLRPAHIESAAGVKLFDTEDRFACISVHYSPRLAKTYNREVPRVLSHFAPFLRGALALNRHVAINSNLNATLAEVLDALALPALILDERCMLLSANRRGALAIERGLVRVGLDNRVTAPVPDHSQDLKQAVRRLCANQGAPEDLVLRARGEVSAVLTLLPLATHALDTPELAWLFLPRRQVLMLIREPAAAPAQVSASLLQSAFNLTPAESRLAIRLASGETLDQAADALGVTKETARTHLKRIFLKTETRRQAELVAFLARLGGPAPMGLSVAAPPS